MWSVVANIAIKVRWFVEKSELIELIGQIIEFDEWVVEVVVGFFVRTVEIDDQYYGL